MSWPRALAKSRGSRLVPARAVRILTTYLLLTGKARLMFRDLHSESLRAAERVFRCA